MPTVEPIADREHTLNGVALAPLFNLPIKFDFAPHGALPIKVRFSVATRSRQSSDRVGAQVQPRDVVG